MKLINLIYSIVKNPVDYTINIKEVGVFKQKNRKQIPFLERSN